MRKLITLLIIFGLLFVACLKNPFTTRDSQNPAGSSGTWETPATPEVVLLNLMFAVTENNIQNYQLCLADDYRFSATQDSIEAEGQGNGYLYRFWDKATEVSAMQNLFTSFAAENKYIDVIFSPSSDYPDDLGDSLSVLYRDYIIRIIDVDTVAADTSFIQGQAEFSISRSMFNWWSIYLWSEVPISGTNDNWADLKAEYRN